MEKVPGRALEEKERAAYNQSMETLRLYIAGESFIEEPDSQWQDAIPSEPGFYFFAPNDENPIQAAMVLVAEHNQHPGRLMGGCSKMDGLIWLKDFPDGIWFGPVPQPPTWENYQQIRFDTPKGQSDERPQGPPD